MAMEHHIALFPFHCLPPMFRIKFHDTYGRRVKTQRNTASSNDFDFCWSMFLRFSIITSNWNESTTNLREMFFIFSNPPHHPPHMKVFLKPKSSCFPPSFRGHEHKSQCYFSSSSVLTLGHGVVFFFFWANKFVGQVGSQWPFGIHLVFLPVN